MKGGEGVVQVHGGGVPGVLRYGEATVSVVVGVERDVDGSLVAL